jgi:hypothetical protein
MIAFIMGQATYNALLEQFRTTEFYNDESVSPFLLSQMKAGTPVGDTLHRIEVNSESRNTGIIRHRVSDMEFSKSIDEIEDHYINQVEVKDRVMDTHPYVIFNINAISSTQASHNRRGIGWVVLLNSKTFENIVEATSYLKGIWEPAQDVSQTIGRWTLVGKKFDRQQHFWAADHIPEDEIITVYRGPDNQSVDGLPVLPRDDGFYYPTESPQSYVWRRKLVTKTETENLPFV